MLLRNTLIFLVSSLFLALLIAGCSDSTTKTDTTGDTNLTDSFGGYKPTAESPAFGDNELMNLPGGMDAEDATGSTALVDSLASPNRANIYSVELAWGHLQYDSTENVITNWSGSLSLERGAIVAVRLLRFEAGDHIVRPRTSPTLLEWVSHTREYFDGMLVYIYDPQPLSFGTPNTLTFATGPYTLTFAMADLDSLNEVVDVGANQFSINAFKVERLACGEGYIDGKWIRNNIENERGVFMGRWISKDGLLRGHVKGHFGARDDGSRVLFGKWISAGLPGDSAAAGAFRGLLRGTWGYAPDVDPDLMDRGGFRGEIYDRTLTTVGHFAGRWLAVVPGHNGGDTGNGNGNDHMRGKGHGFMRGVWQQECGQ
ncbi:MAG: hypothetical protein NT028_14715 [candidate division Zixibacteria bacterium]|nr:hypothetical protein [candidate division Zixibacteria bacterium]